MKSLRRISPMYVAIAAVVALAVGASVYHWRDAALRKERRDRVIDELTEEVSRHLLWDAAEACREAYGDDDRAGAGARQDCTERARLRIIARRGKIREHAAGQYEAIWGSASAADGASE